MEERRRADRVQEESVHPPPGTADRAVLTASFWLAATASTANSTAASPSPAPTPKSPAAPSPSTSSAAPAAVTTTTTNKPGPSPAAGETSTSAAAPPVRRQSSGGPSGAPRTHKSDGIAFGQGDNNKTGDKTREKCCELIYDALAQDSGARAPSPSLLYFWTLGFSGAG